MPILDVDKSQNVVVIKRSMSPGFAGIDNPLFYDPKTVMLFDDAKAAMEKLIAAVEVRLSRVPFFSANDVDAAVSPERALEAVREAFVAYCARRVVDAAEGLRPRVPGGGLSRDAGSGRRPCVAEVGDLLSRETRRRGCRP